MRMLAPHCFFMAMQSALAHYRRCIEIAPDRNGPAYMIAALGEGPAPDRAPVDYVSDFFDWYAEQFDTPLTGNLNYTGPLQVAGTLRVLRPDGVGRVVDMGCGTGLAGLAVQGLVGPMTGLAFDPCRQALYVTDGQLTTRYVVSKPPQCALKSERRRTSISSVCRNMKISPPAASAI